LLVKQAREPTGTEWHPTPIQVGGLQRLERVPLSHTMCGGENRRDRWVGVLGRKRGKNE